MKYKLNRMLSIVLVILLSVSNVSFATDTDNITISQELQDAEIIESSDEIVENSLNNAIDNSNIEIFDEITENNIISNEYEDFIVEENDYVDSNLTTVDSDTWQYNYTGAVQTFTAPYTGKYYIKTVGAGSEPEGKGGYVSGYINLYAGDNLYIVCGSAGGRWLASGYNGGGSSVNGAGSGGGATSVTRTNRGELKNFASYKNEVVAVGGGAGGVASSYPYIPKDFYFFTGGFQGHGGGLSAPPLQMNCPYEYGIVYGTTDTTGYAFGYGQNSRTSGGISTGAGGGGWFGGYTSIGYNWAGGTGGSGYGGGLYDVKAEVGVNLGNGYCTISYEGVAQSAISINPGNGGYYNGSSDVTTITGSVGTNVSIANPVCKPGYTFIGYKIIKKNGTENFSGGNITLTFDSIQLVAKYKAPLQLTVAQDGNNSLNMNFIEDDEYDKTYKVWQSSDNIHWGLAKTSTNDINTHEQSYPYYFTRGVRSFTTTADAIWKIEAFGGAGGDASVDEEIGNSIGNGAGGYSVGYTNDARTFYFVTGGKGEGFYEGAGYIGTSCVGGGATGGYNGGGQGGIFDDRSGPAGGGATSITTTNRGELKNFASYKNEVVMVAGGGGGGGGYGGGTTGGSSDVGGSGGTQNAPGFNIAEPWGIGDANAAKGGFGYGGTSTHINGAGGGGYYGGGAGVSYHGAGGGGGSGYVNSNYLYDAETIGGNIKPNLGDGYVIFTKIIQDVPSNQVHGLIVEDKVAPNIPSNGNYTTGDIMTISWQGNGDNGSKVYYKVQSIDKNTGNILNTSDVQSTFYMSGLKGYYYYIDSNPTGTVTKNHTFTTNTSITTPVSTSKRWMHIAAVDYAGNLSGTYNFEIPNIAHYTVKHYLMNTDGVNYTLVDSDRYEALIGSTVTPPTKSYTGFTTPASQSGVVEADGSLEIKYYYTRHKSTLRIEPNNGYWMLYNTYYSF